MKRILYLTFYFEPDLSACSFRNTPLAKELALMAEGKATVDVITTTPHRYNSFMVQTLPEETKGNLNIRRIAMPKHKGGFPGQINSFLYYFNEVHKIVGKKKYDLVFASSSRLFTAYLGYRIARKNKAVLYLDIRDIFKDTMNDVLQNRLLKNTLLTLLNYVERKVYSYASHINLISEGFYTYFKNFNKPSYSFFSNGIDEDFILSENEPGYHIDIANPMTITYAGNIGEGQGLHKIIPQVALRTGDRFFFRVIGDGNAKIQLEEEVARLGLRNVRIEAPVSRNELVEIYKSSHFLCIFLNDYKAFEKVLPSKIFEAGAMPRPILAGVGGYAKKFIEQNIDNAIVFEPGNDEQLLEALNSYKYHYSQRSSFINKYRRVVIDNAMAVSILEYL